MLPHGSPLHLMSHMQSITEWSAQAGSLACGCLANKVADNNMLAEPGVVGGMALVVILLGIGAFVMCRGAVAKRFRGKPIKDEEFIRPGSSQTHQLTRAGSSQTHQANGEHGLHRLNYIYQAGGVLFLQWGLPFTLLDRAARAGATLYYSRA